VWQTYSVARQGQGQEPHRTRNAIEKDRGRMHVQFWIDRAEWEAFQRAVDGAEPELDRTTLLRRYIREYTAAAGSQ
jgi:hypothetical protein